MVLRGTSELRQPLAKETVAILTAVDVSVADHVRLLVGDRQMSVDTVVLIDICDDEELARDPLDINCRLKY